MVGDSWRWVKKKRNEKVKMKEGGLRSHTEEKIGSKGSTK